MMLHLGTSRGFPSLRIPRHSLFTNGCLKLPALLSLLALVASCNKPATSQNLKDDDCPGRPTDVVLTDPELKLAGIQIGKASVGNVEFRTNSKLMPLLTDRTRTLLVTEFLICNAEKRGEINKDDSVSVTYLRKLFTYTYASNPPPTPAELSAWIRENLPTSAPKDRPAYHAGASDIDPSQETCLPPPIPANVSVCVNMHGDWSNGSGPLGHSRLGAVSVLTRRASDSSQTISSAQIYAHSNWFRESDSYIVCVKPPGNVQRSIDVGDRMSVDVIERTKEMCPSLTERP